jgi:hypothetical protein
VPDFMATPLYCLLLRPTTTGKLYVERRDWELWFNDPVTTNERRVSGWLADREEARRWAESYTDDHPGCIRDARQVKAWAKKAA